MGRGTNKRSIRNLAQYKSLSEDEFEELYERKQLDVAPILEFDRRVDRKLSQFEEEYDLSDMKINDREQLRSLARSLITLEDNENYLYKLRQEGINVENLSLVEKIGRQNSDLLSTISKIQDDLRITRKVRKGDKEESVITFIQDLKSKARKFYESRMSYIYCPKCNMNLGTFWVLYPNAKNKITLTCQRELDNGETCNTQVTVTTQELMKNRGTNKPEIMPDSML